MSENEAGKPDGEGQGDPAIGGSAAPPEKLLRARQVLLDVLGHLGVEADVEVRDAAEAIACNVQIRSGGALFERSPRGQVLESVQYLVNKMVNRDLEGKKRVAVDLGAFRDTATDPVMEEMARRLGESARKIGKPLTILPMQSRDRRVVHVALTDVPGVATRSEGDGLLRRLIVEPGRGEKAPARTEE